MPKPDSQIFECLPAYTIKPLSLQAWLVAVVCPGRQGYAHACAYGDIRGGGKCSCRRPRAGSTSFVPNGKNDDQIHALSQLMTWNEERRTLEKASSSRHDSPVLAQALAPPRFVDGSNALAGHLPTLS